jgi:hypothetical protein
MANIKVGVIDNDCMAKVADVCTSDELCALLLRVRPVWKIGLASSQIRCDVASLLQMQVTSYAPYFDKVASVKPKENNSRILSCRWISTTSTIRLHTVRVCVQAWQTLVLGSIWKVNLMRIGARLTPMSWATIRANPVVSWMTCSAAMELPIW